MRAKLKKILRFAGICFGLWLLGLTIGCPIRRLTGIPCLTCGMSRAWKNVFQFRLRLAMEYHPLFWMAPWIVILLFRGDSCKNRMAKRRQFIELAVISILMMGVYVWRILLVPHGPVGIHLTEGLAFKIIHIMTA